MIITFYPGEDEFSNGNLDEKIEALVSYAETYIGVVLDKDNTKLASTGARTLLDKALAPLDLTISYNWEMLASVLQEIRAFQEGSIAHRTQKAVYLEKLAEVYETLRAAKMPKLEAVRLALVSEAAQLKTQ